MEEQQDGTGDEEEFEQMVGLLDNYPTDDPQNSHFDSTEDGRTTEEEVVIAFQDEVDPKLVDAGWGLKSAKSVEHGKTDQSLANHVRNGVFALAHLNELIDSVGGYQLDEAGLRDTVALFTIHDIHKLDPERDTDAETRFDIPKEEIDAYVEQFDLLNWSESLTIKDFHSCAIDHHNDWAANHAESTPTFDDYRPFVRLADALASCATPEAATEPSVADAIAAAFPGAEATLRHHVLDDVKGILTNLINAALADTLETQGHRRLLVYQDGCVYLSEGDTSAPSLDNEFIEQVFETLKSNVQNAHPAYQNARGLADNLATRYAHNFYGINDQDFFYAGSETVLFAVTLKATTDADPDSDPTDSMVESMEKLEAYLPFSIDRSREPVGLARLAYTVKRTFVDPVLETRESDVSSLGATCAVFDVPPTVKKGLETAADEVDLTAGGKWDYAYGIGQALLEEGMTSQRALLERVVAGLDEMDEDWREVVETDRAGNLKSELDAYIRDIVSVSGQSVTETGDDVTDPFEQYHGTRRGKTCVLCNRGTTSGRKSDMKAPKSLTTLQAGYSNHIPVDAGKPDELLACLPCQIELSLRETGSSRRDDGRLWIHLIPDYFYTPLSWRSYTAFVQNFQGEASTELGRLAESVLALREGGGSRTSNDRVLGSYVDALLDSDTGRSMLETLDQNFEPDAQYGARTFGYFKPKDNDTEFQFFGVFTALALASYTGLRVNVSESPIPDIRGRDFQTFVRLDGGFTQVHEFYGREIPLSALESRLAAAAALIKLGYGADRDDALFAKYLRATRNKPLPGSYLLKRLAQADDGDNARFLLEEARVLDELCGGNV